MMDQLIKKFPAQLREAIEIGEKAVIHPHTKPIHKVIMAGMGGSGIGGAYVADLISDECSVPYIIQSSYKLPAYTDENTLVIVSSYSGNTEETIAAMEQSILAKAKVVCIASGGKIIDKALAHKLDHLNLPKGWPSPRACLGFSMVGQLFVLNKMGLISHNIIDQVRVAADLLSFEQEDIMQKAEKLAGLLVKKTPVIYTTDRNESVAIRWRQQINENAKVLCWHHVIPEMNHNELVGWRNNRPDVAVVWLRNRDDFQRTAVRMNINKEIVEHF
nr:SIS domain-containing protein [Saprospiraceae bacterium]